MSIRRHLAWLAMVVLAAVAGVGVWQSVASSSPPDVAAVGADLRCPACNGETVADSGSPVAASMRASIAEQLAQGRSEAQIRQWFVDRYGPEVLTDPAGREARLLLWLLPAAGFSVVVLLAVRTARRRTSPMSRSDTGRPASRWLWDVVALGLVVMVGAVAVVGLRMKNESEASTAAPVVDVQAARAMEEAGDYPGAVEIYRRVLAGNPDPDTRLRLAYALLRTNRPAEAEDAARTVLTRHPRKAEALLVLGLAERAQGSAGATATLRRFLQLAPGHPAAAEIRRLVG